MTKKDGFSGWLKCTHCQELIHKKELQQCFHCCPKCDHHYRLSAMERIASLADEETFQELFDHLTPCDPLGFIDVEPYVERLKNAKEKSDNNEAIVVGTCQIKSIPIALAAMDFNFMAGSMGSVVGEKLTLLIEYALSHHLPLIVVTSSGGARMQESIYSLMQMAKTSAALARFHEACLPYITVLTNPTTGGVTASFASLGDIILAEPNALICFAGPRVVEQTIRHQLPPEAQRSEFLLKHGMIDCIVRRPAIRNKLADLLPFLTQNQKNHFKTKVRGLSESQL